jgi:hypothetical protein
VDDIVTSITADSSPGVAKAGAAPSPGGGPVVTVSGNDTIINGGTLPVSIASGSPFDVLYVVVGGKTVGLENGSPGGIDGYYEIRLPSPRTSASAVLAFGQSIPLPQLDLLFAVASSPGPVGPFAPLSTTALQVGTGDVQVSLSWDVDSDLDLHVVDPSGEEIYYSHKQARSGGSLDLDSNAACSLDHKRNENITWPAGRAPQGQYTVRVDYWDRCQTTQSNYTVRIITNEGFGRIVSGSFTGEGDEGGAGSGRLIATFQKVTGPTATHGAPVDAPASVGSSKGAASARRAK